jgi:phosphotransferase system enzyme I (PtsI)
MMKTLLGIPVSSGIVIGKAFLYRENTFPEIPRFTVSPGEVEDELRRLAGATEEAVGEMKSLYKRAGTEMSVAQADIFATHIMMLEDSDFQDQLSSYLRRTLHNAEWVVYEIAQDLMRKMMSSPDPRFRERAVDINDVSKRLLHHLLSLKRVSLDELEEEVVVVAHDLLPSEVLTMNKRFVKGLVMDAGSKTSHTAILARAFGIPAVLGLAGGSAEIEEGDLLVVNGSNGQVLCNPEEDKLLQHQGAAAQYYRKLERSQGIRTLKAETKDGRRVLLKANIGIPEEAEQALRYGAEGIGLYRSEFLFLSPGQAAEEERQYQAYSRVLKAMGDLPVTIRTVDIGGDKLLPNFPVTNEKNPLLGWRAIRFSLSNPDLFKTQLRAILRSSVHGNVRIMFPLISGIEELEQALMLLEEAKAECRGKRQPYAGDIEAGAMIEVPSAAMIADILAERCAFFSIGTNDLIQYSLAVDRGNERVNYLAQPTHPAVIRFLKKTIDAAHEKGISAAMCGEMAGDPSATLLLLGLGLDEFSMAAPAIPQIKRIIREVSLEDCRALAEELLKGISWQQNAVIIEAWMAENLLPEATGA